MLSALQNQMCYFGEINVKTREEKKRRKKKDKRITVWLITSKFDSVQTILTTETFESAK